MVTEENGVDFIIANNQCFSINHRQIIKICDHGKILPTVLGLT